MGPSSWRSRPILGATLSQAGLEFVEGWPIGADRMIPEKMHVGHYRAVRNCTISFSDNTALVGANGVGKSTFLQALRFFFEPGIATSAEDQQFGCEDDISVAVTLGSLSESERETYADSLDGEGYLTVTKASSPERGSNYFVSGMKYAGFDELRDLYHEKATVFTPAYKAFVDIHPDLDLAKPRAMAECKAELKRFEHDHPELLEPANVEFDFVGSTKTQLIATTRVVYVPAVHRVDDDFRAGGRSPLSQMIDALVMPEVNGKPEYLALRERWAREYQEIFPVGGTAELQDLAARLSGAISDFVPGTEVKLSWSEFVPDVQTPDIDSFVSEDGVPTQIDKKGHGLQRAMIIALLQARDEQLRETVAEATENALSHVLLLIEEPELYQHPPRARHFRRVLAKLATTPGKNCRFRVVSTTHSPSFVSLEDIESIRIVRKEMNEGRVPVRRISAVTLAEIADEFARVTGDARITESWLLKNLHALDDALREAFFSSAIVLTEGVSDIGILSAEAERSGVDLEASGIVMASIDGKGQIPLAVTILKMLGIKHYVVFDADGPAQLGENQRVLRSLGVPEADITRMGTPETSINAAYSILKPKIEAIVLADVGPAAYNKAVADAAALFGRNKDDVMKNPACAKSVMESLHEQGLKSENLSKILVRLAAL